MDVTIENKVLIHLIIFITEANPPVVCQFSDTSNTRSMAQTSQQAPTQTRKMSRGMDFSGGWNTWFTSTWQLGKNVITKQSGWMGVVCALPWRAHTGNPTKTLWKNKRRSKQAVEEPASVRVIVHKNQKYVALMPGTYYSREFPI